MPLRTCSARRALLGAGALTVLAALVVGGWTAPGERMVVPQVEGCPPFPTDRPGEVETRVPSEGVTVASDVVRPDRPEPWGALRDLLSAHRRWTSREVHHLPSSGLVVEVITDGDRLVVDPLALDRLARIPLEVGVADPRVAALLDCYRQRILEHRELEGTRLRLLVPADPAVCVRGLRLRPAAPGRSCDAAGLTIPPVVGQDGVVIVAPGRVGDRALAAERAALILVHELVHHYDSHLGLYPYPWSWRAFEQRAHYVDRRVRALVRDGTVDLPLPLTWTGEDRRG